MRRFDSYERCHSHGKLFIQVYQGDIVRERVDVIVNAANGSLMHGGGVAGAISCAGGRQLDDESREWVKKHGRVPDGEVAYTTGGAMKHLKYVIHAVGPIYRGGYQKEELKLYNSVLNSLKKATELECKSISIPAISSGIFGYPKEECAKIFYRAIKDYIRSYGDSQLELIRLCNFDSPTVNVFVKEFDRTDWNLEDHESTLKSPTYQETNQHIHEEEKKAKEIHKTNSLVNYSKSVDSGDSASDTEVEINTSSHSEEEQSDPVDASMKSTSQSNLDISMASSNQPETKSKSQDSELIQDLDMKESIVISSPTQEPSHFHSSEYVEAHSDSYCDSFDDDAGSE